MKKDGMKTLVFLLFFIGSLSSCEDSNYLQSRDVSLDCLYDNYESMLTLQDTARIGEADGTFPSENADLLQIAIEDIELGISKGIANQFTLQYEVDNYCISAEKAIAEFQNSYQETLAPGTPGELIIYGIDGKGRIEFGSDPAFGGSDAFCVESWIKYDENFFESGIGDFIATFDNSTQPNEGWMINFLGDNMRSTIGMGPQHSRVLEWGKKFPTNYGEWNHIAMVYDASLSEGQLKMYLNGEVFFSKTNDVVDNSGVLQSYQPNTKNYNMWAFQEPTDKSRCMTGYIRKFRFWNVAKTESDINTLMNSDVTGSESGLECAWDFVEVPENNEAIPDKTGKHTAKIVGNYKWIKN
ncbi:LamG-like jellyroll fold domain-containing protein [Saccharicrinis carchari]|nr:LamG-like jellyroll fold domain-containing protein [Saccharicrinis carchari]